MNNREVYSGWDRNRIEEMLDTPMQAANSRRVCR